MVYHLKCNPKYKNILKLTVNINLTGHSVTWWLLLIHGNLLNSFIANVENVHHLLKDKHPLIYMPFV